MQCGISKDNRCLWADIWQLTAKETGLNAIAKYGFSKK